MPVKHDLFQDLGVSKEEVQSRRKENARLDSLLRDYDRIDAEVLEAESASGTLNDDELKKQKEKRLLVKDKIKQQIEYSNKA